MLSICQVYYDLLRWSPSRTLYLDDHYHCLHHHHRHPVPSLCGACLCPRLHIMISYMPRKCWGQDQNPCVLELGVQSPQKYAALHTCTSTAYSLLASNPFFQLSSSTIIPPIVLARKLEVYSFHHSAGPAHSDSLNPLDFYQLPSVYVAAGSGEVPSKPPSHCHASSASFKSLLTLLPERPF